MIFSAYWDMQDRTTTVAVIGCFDTKAEDFGCLIACLEEMGQQVLTINLGVHEAHTNFTIHVPAEEVAKSADSTLEFLQAQGDRSTALDKMSLGAAQVLQDLIESDRVQGIIGMGGGGGTFMFMRAIQSVPFGIPKVCISTVANKDLSRQMGSKDVVLIPSLVDVAGLNSISRTLLRQAAGAIKGMIEIGLPPQDVKRKTIAISMFGNTTSCVTRCTELLRQENFDVLPFHAVGSGGRTMENLIREGLIDGVLDITTTELADELCGGICAAGTSRLTAAGEMGIPQVVAPGCLDMVNFAEPTSVPERYRDRLLHSWAPDVTLLRTNVKENTLLGLEMARKLNDAKGDVTVILPSKGISLISMEGKTFHLPEADQALFTALAENLSEEVHLVKMETDINSPEFAQMAVSSLLEYFRGE
ncbi:MAG: Tm-1-like ATP-binding domain-containing protein [Saprospiraceae bacterium]|nr:Tm-1-like ATP-binding domain-containing protein [Saprospiraceae bacterium]